jgi:hypothetical protein
VVERILININLILTLMNNDFQKRGPFLCKNGPARERNEDPSQKKLCFASTDKQFMLHLLSHLAERKDCYFVKMTDEPRDGLYLGRCFLTDSQQVGMLWAQYKGHPKLFCNVQDDEFTKPFRENVVDWKDRPAESLD